MPTALYRARQAVATAAVMYGIATGRKTLEARRELRGRPGEVVVHTFKTLQAIFTVPALILAAYLAADAIGGPFAHIAFFVLLAVVFVSVAALLAWTVTLVSLGVVELVASARPNSAVRPGYFFTCEQIHVQQLYWTEIAYRSDDEMVGEAFSGGVLRGPVARSAFTKARAFKELNRTMALREQVMNGVQIWIRD